jgi:putative mRNA 3-end processing factor
VLVPPRSSAKQVFMPVELRKGGLHVTGTPLWLDARRRSELSFVSHAHTDHIAKHERVIATAATLRIMEHRLGPLAATLPVPYHRPFKLGDLDVELLPAGHVLGSAQIRLTRPDGHRVAYTGDIGLEPSATAEPASVAECDTLVLESTFGLPRFRFPPKEKVVEEIAAWAKRALSRGVRPVLYAYSLGKGQEIIHQLLARGMAVCAHPSIYDVSQLYGELGVKMSVRRFDGTFEAEEVGVFPPFGRSQALKQTHPKTTAVLTGWALESWAARRYGADVAFPLSDHADFPALLRYAKESRAREIITHHGFARELAKALTEQGLFARAVTQAVQMELPLLGAAPQAELAL